MGPWAWPYNGIHVLLVQMEMLNVKELDFNFWRRKCGHDFEAFFGTGDAYPVGFRRDATARLKIEANQDSGSLTVRIRKGQSKGWEREIQKDSRAGAERSFSLTSSREIMSAVVESAMGGRPPIFAQRQRVVGATRVARNSACVERSWMPAGGKRAREEADIETAKFWERTDRMWDMLQVRLSRREDPRSRHDPLQLL